MSPLRKIATPGKVGISIAVRTGKTERENTHIIQCIEHYYNHLGIKPLGNISATGVDEIGDVLNQDEILKRAYELGLKIGQGKLT